MQSFSKEACVKRQRLDACGSFQQQSQALFEASYAAILIIAKKIKPFIIGETLFKLCALQMARNMLAFSLWCFADSSQILT